MKKVIVLLTVILLFGLTSCTPILKDNQLRVLSDSMSPEIKNGDTITYDKVPFDSLKIGDIIVYTMQEQTDVMYTSRIIDINEDETGTYLIVKGDANNMANIEPIYETNYIGKVVKIN